MSIVEAMIPVIEIVIISIAVNYILSFFWNTRSMDLLLGMVAFLALYIAVFWLNFPILKQIMLLVTNVAMIAILIIFHPELRIALSKLSFKLMRNRDLTEFDLFLDHLCNSVYHLAERRTGALIVLEREDTLEEYAKKGIGINANFSSELLETIFTGSSPLHDGAIIFRDQKILAASVIIPLAEDSGHEVPTSLGTRHRAALGLSQISDALIIVISEESGLVSIAREGVLTRGVKTDRFTGIIRSIFATPRERESKKRFQPLKWLWQ